MRALAWHLPDLNLHDLKFAAVRYLGLDDAIGIAQGVDRLLSTHNLRLRKWPAAIDGTTVSRTTSAIGHPGSGCSVEFPHMKATRSRVCSVPKTDSGPEQNLLLHYRASTA